MNKGANNHLGFLNFPTNSQWALFSSHYPADNQYGIRLNPGTGDFTKSIGAPFENWRVWEIVWTSAPALSYYVNSTHIFTSDAAPSTSTKLYFCADSPSSSISEIDWVFVRKYTATEPTISTWGSEEEQFPKYLTVDFSGVPTSGYVPLTVYFTDATVGYNVTLDTWAWSFGDTSQNSTQQDPAHTYTTSGLYNVILTVTNTSFSKTNTTQKTAYINVTVNPDAPNADFTVTETCGETSDIFYFIDFSTGGGLYAWNWSFGDGAYSELRNPTHQYSSNGTYDVGLSVWGAYGNDTLTRSNLITIPCGAATPTPTVTPTVTGTPVFTEGNATFIYAPDQDYVPFPIWLAIVIVTIALFGHSIIFLKNSDLTAIMAALFAMVSAWLSNMIGYIDVQVTSYAEEIVISPVIQAVHPPWLVYTMLIFAFVSVVNIFAAIYKVYLKPVPYNEIYDRKLPKWERRK
jgi:PKD repeat protein